MTIRTTDTTELTQNVAIDSRTLTHLLEHGDPIVVLDVRRASEREEWHIPGSIHLDLYDALRRNAPEALAGVDLPDDRPIVTVCGAGKTSLIAAEELRRQGKQAVSLEGGMKAWSLAFNTATARLDETPAEVIQVRRTGKGCLSYVIGAGGEAAVIDASLAPEVYVGLAREHGWEIIYVLDTHIHADHLSRSRGLAEATGSTLYLPEQQRVAFPYTPVRDGDVLTIGGARLQAIRTPGHTDDSTCFLLDAVSLFTGDTLFTDGVGRPDLKASSDAVRARAETLYDSLQRLLRDVPPEAVVLPGHASRPVPFDERAIGDRLDTVRSRVAALSAPKEEFVEHLLGRIPPTPPNYERIVELNEAGTTAVENILELEAGANRCAIS